MKNSTLRLIIALLAVILAAGALTVVFASGEDFGVTDGTATEECKHEKNDVRYLSASPSQHKYSVICLDCGVTVEEEAVSDHTWQSNKCKDCTYTCKVPHISSYFLILEKYPSAHMQMYTCDYCDYVKAVESPHDFVDMKCKSCAYVCDHGNGNAFGFDAEQQRYCCVNHCGKLFAHYYVDGNIVFYEIGENFLESRPPFGLTEDAYLMGDQYLALCDMSGNPVSPYDLPSLGGSYQLLDKGHAAIIAACTHLIVENGEEKDTHVFFEETVSSYCSQCGHQAEGKG